MSANPRSIAKARRSGTKRPSKKTLILGDGKSEVVYFRGFIGRDRPIVVKPVGTETSDLNQMLRIAANHVREFGLDPKAGDRVAVVMDIDFQYTKAELVDRGRKFAEKGIEVYASNPSFEVWLILHFEKCTKYGIPDEMTEHLSSIMLQRRGHRYEKSKGIDWTEDMVDTALKNASLIQKKDECTLEWCSDTKPSTMVHKLVETIR